jgi:hypothetical protein
MLVSDLARHSIPETVARQGLLAAPQQPDRFDIDADDPPLGVKQHNALTREVKGLLPPLRCRSSRALAFSLILFAGCVLGVRGWHDRAPSIPRQEEERAPKQRHGRCAFRVAVRGHAPWHWR